MRPNDRWTKQAPTEPGWYWWREHVSMSGLVVRVTDSLQVRYGGFGDPLCLWTGEWYGPLVEPPTIQRQMDEEGV
jgi:hypothetical protein